MSIFVLRKRKAVNYSDDTKSLKRDHEVAFSASTSSAKAPVAAKKADGKEISCPKNGEAEFVRLYDCRITNSKGLMLSAQKIVTGVTLRVTGVKEDGTKVCSAELNEWFGWNIGSAFPVLGVETVKDSKKKINYYLLQSPHAEYTALFNESRAPVSFAAFIVENVVQKRDLPLRDLSAEYFGRPGPESSWMRQNYKSPNQFVRQHLGEIVPLLLGHWSGTFPKAQSCRELKSLRDGNIFEKGSAQTEVFSALSEQCLVTQEHLLKMQGQKSWARLQTGCFDNFKNAKTQIVCQFNSSTSQNPRRFIAQVDVYFRHKMKFSLEAGNFIEFRSDSQHIFTGRIKHMNVANAAQTAHVQQFCTAEESMLGSHGNQKELFATSNCADVPFAAIVKQLEAVRFGEPKGDELFCVLKTCPEGGYIELNTAQQKGSTDCSTCRENKLMLKARKRAVRIGNTNSVMYNGDVYRKNSCVRLQQDIEEETNQYTRESTKGTNFQYVMPQAVALITDIQFEEKKKPKVTLKLLGRPEYKHSDKNARKLHQNILLPSTEEEITCTFSGAEIAGKAYVADIKNVNNIDDWVNQGPNRFFFKEKIPGMHSDNSMTSDDPAPDYLQLPEAEKLSSLDLCCGAGLMSYGLQESGLTKVSWGVDSDKNCTDSFKKNFPDASALTMPLDKFNQLISEGEKNYQGQALPSTGEVGLLCGGTPCQGFSTLNKHLDSDASALNRVAVCSFLSTVDLLEPKYVLLENVPAMSKHENGNFIKYILRGFRELRYQFRVIQIQCAGFGVAQSRQRIFILAAKWGLPLPEFPLATHNTSWSQNWHKLVINNIEIENKAIAQGAPYRELYATEAIGDLPQEAAANCEYAMRPQNAYQAKMREGNSVLSHHVAAKSTPLKDMRYSMIKNNWKNLPNTSLMLSDGTMTTVLKYKEHKKSPENPVVCPCQVGAKKDCKKETLKKKYSNSLIPFSLAHTAHKNSGWKNCYGRVPTAGLATTATTSLSPLARQGQVLHPTAARILTAQELARLQGVPDKFQFCGKNNSVISQIGNGVPPPVTFQLGQKIIESILAHKK